MFSKYFCGGTQGTQISSPIETLKQTLSTLEDKKLALQKKISLEVERAKKFERVTNRQAALQCLKRKKYYEDQLKKLGTFQVLVRNQLYLCRKQKLPVQTDHTDHKPSEEHDQRQLRYRLSNFYPFHGNH